MRSLIITLTLLALALALMLGAAFHMAHCCDRLQSDLDTLAQKNDPASEVEALKEYWQEREWLLNAITPRSEVQSVQKELLTLRCSLESGLTFDDTAVQVTLALLRDTLQSLKQDALPFGS